MAGRQLYVQTCKFPGCSKPCYVEPYGRVHDFCGRTHADDYRKQYGSYYGVGHSPLLPSSTSKYPAIHSSKGKSSSSTRQPMKAIHNPPVYSHVKPSSLGSSHKIKFYNRDEPYYEFTNFYSCPVHIDGQVWPTTEHYFQAQKFIGTPYMDRIRRLHHPRDAFQLSRDPKVSRWRRSDWDSVKDDVMLKALRVKFSDQNPKLLKRLLGTGDKELVEHTSNDSYWGDGGNGTGSNKLGQLLMQVRSELRARRGASMLPPVGRSQDDSALSPPRGTSPFQSPSSGSLKRSSSFSTLRSTPGQQHPPGRSVTGGASAPRQTSYGSLPPKGGYPSHQRGKGQNTQSSFADQVKNSAKAVKDMATSAASHATKALQGGSSSQGNKHRSHAHTPQSGGTGTRSHDSSRRRANSSSVGYNIITHREWV